MIRDQNGNRVTKSIRRESDGTWSANVWWGGANGFATNVQRRHGYKSRAAARNADISESAEQTNRRH
jgi:hypothetical protein